MLQHVPAFVNTSEKTGGWVTNVKQDFLCTRTCAQRVFFYFMEHIYEA